MRIVEADMTRRLHTMALYIMPEQPCNQKLAGGLCSGERARSKGNSSKSGQDKEAAHLEGVKSHAPSLLRVRHRDTSSLHLALQVCDQLLRNLHLHPSTDYGVQNDYIIASFKSGIQTGSHIST